MSDFDNWYTWVQRTYPTYALTEATARKMYDDWYDCACESCTYRKGMGQMPVRLSAQCTTPIQQLDPDHIKDVSAPS
jgi:hypothetical protein